MLKLLCHKYFYKLYNLNKKNITNTKKQKQKQKQKIKYNIDK